MQPGHLELDALEGRFRGLEIPIVRQPFQRRGGGARLARREDADGRLEGVRRAREIVRIAPRDRLARHEQAARVLGEEGLDEPAHEVLVPRQA
jgi:hypothetical protein